MSLLESLNTKVNDKLDSLGWYLRNSDPVHLFQKGVERMFNAERGTEMPYYMPNVLAATKNYLNNTIIWWNQCVYEHQSSLIKKSKEHQNYYTRIMDVESSFYRYSNETMFNI